MTNFYLTSRKTIFGSLSMLVFLVWATVAVGGSYSPPDAAPASHTLTTCQAQFESQAYDGSTPSVGGVTFYNFSEGDYEHLSWDFGDGSVSSSTGEVLDHFYANSGTYEVTLTIWNDDQSCNSTVTKSVSVTVSNDPCDLTECVYPGDANRDGQADLYDLLHLGMGFGAEGPERPNATNEWVGQPGPDWNVATGDGIDYKHLDADGNGTIDWLDLMPLLGNYAPMVETSANTENDGPRLYLDFAEDTIFIDENTPDLVTLSAGVVIGNADHPIEDLHGLALFLDYDTTLTEASSGVSIDYNQNSFMGNGDEVIAYGHDQRMYKQFDIGVSKTNGQGSNGFGRIATSDFTVIIDIIDGRAEPAVPFDVPINGVVAKDSQGNPIEISVDTESAKVVFVKQGTTSTRPSPLDHRVRVYPNPVDTENVTIDLQDLQGQYVQFYNALGQRVRSYDLSVSKTQVDVSDLATGVYQLHIQTVEGVVNKRLLVE